MNYYKKSAKNRVPELISSVSCLRIGLRIIWFYWIRSRESDVNVCAQCSRGISQTISTCHTLCINLVFVACIFPLLLHINLKCRMLLSHAQATAQHRTANEKCVNEGERDDELSDDDGRWACRVKYVVFGVHFVCMAYGIHFKWTECSGVSGFINEHGMRWLLYSYNFA